MCPSLSLRMHAVSINCRAMQVRTADVIGKLTSPSNLRCILAASWSRNPQHAQAWRDA